MVGKDLACIYSNIMLFPTHMSKAAIFHIMQNVFDKKQQEVECSANLCGLSVWYSPHPLFSSQCHILCSIVRLNLLCPWQTSSQMNYDDFYLDSNAGPSQKAFNSSKFHNNPMNIFSTDLSCWTNKLKTVVQSWITSYACGFHAMCLEMINDQ